MLDTEQQASLTNEAGAAPLPDAEYLVMNHRKFRPRAERLDGALREARRAMKPSAGIRVFVDGNNVMGSRPDGWWRDRGAAARRLVAELEPVARRLGGKWMVVFDGCSPPGKAAGPATAVSVEYALHRGADAADDRIVALIAALPERSDVLVYTSDRRLRERVAALGVHVKGAGALWELATTA